MAESKVKKDEEKKEKKNQTKTTANKKDNQTTTKSKGSTKTKNTESKPDTKTNKVEKKEEQKEKTIKTETKETKTETTENKPKSKKKVILIVVSIILIIVLACAGLGTYYYFNENKKITEISTMQEQAFLEFSDEVKYGQEISYNDLLPKLVDTNKLQENTNIILEINSKEIKQDETFKFEELGTYNVKVKLEYKYNYSIITSLSKMIESEKTTEIVIEDKEPPTINGVADKEITVGDQINLQEGITATDNVDGEVEVKVEGEVDNNKVGEYKIKVTATDKSGNNAESSFKVTVKEKPKVETNTAQKGTTANNGTNKANGNGGGTTAVASTGDNITDIVRLTNQYRAEVGLGALSLNSKLSAAAQKRATELVSNCSHTRPDGSYFDSIFVDYDIHTWNYGENIAWGQTNGVSVAQTWRNSPGHYKNMIRNGGHYIGIGAYNAGGRWYWVQLITDSV